MGDPETTFGKFVMYTTSDGGNNWIPVPVSNIPVSTGETSWPGGFSSVNDTLWFGTKLGRIFKSTDKGLTWSATQVIETTEELIIPVFRNGSHGLAFNIWGKSKLFETFDGGMTWEMVNYSGKLYQTSLAYVPGTPDTWVSTGGISWIGEAGASFSTDGGHTWTQFPGTQGALFRNMAWISPQNGWAGGFNIGSMEGGIFKFVGDLSASSAINDHRFEPYSFSVYPNPSSGSVVIELGTGSDANIEIAVFNLIGAQIKNFPDIKYSSGRQPYFLNLYDVPDGIYFIRIRSGTRSGTEKVIKISEQGSR